MNSFSIREQYFKAERDAERRMNNCLVKSRRRQSCDNQTDIPVVLNGVEGLGEDVGGIKETEPFPSDAESESTFSSVNFPCKTGFAEKWNHCVKFLNNSIRIVSRTLHCLSCTDYFKNFSCRVNPSKSGLSAKQ